MLTTPHALVGIALVAKLPPVIGLPLALASHFILDFLIPHWNPHLFTEMEKDGRLSKNTLIIIALDGLLAASLVIFFSFTTASLWPIGGAFLATLPDWLEAPFYLFKVKIPFLVKYVTFEHLHQAKAGIFLGILTQAVIIVLSLLILL